MKPSHDPLDRLFRSAAQAPARSPAVLPSGAEFRILAAWRRGEPDGELAAVLGLFRRGLAVACALTAVVSAVCWLNLARPTPNLAMEEFALSADALNVAFAP